MIKDYFILAFRNLRKRKLRSWLTMIGIFISIATIFILVALSFGLQDSVNEQFQALGTDKFFIQPKGQLGFTTSDAAQLTLEDVDVVEKVGGIKTVSYMTMGNAKIEFNDQKRYYIVAGLPVEDKERFDVLVEGVNLEPMDGRLIKRGDGHKVMLGSRYKEVFKKPINPGNKIELNDEEFRVVGILESVGNPQDDLNIYITYESFQELYNSSNRVDYIYVQINSNQEIADVSERVKQRLMDFRDVDEKTIDFTILTPEQLLESFQNILIVITIFLLGVAGISLVVGGIGIANTMYTSVLERTKEIGIMKAIGARNSEIISIFVIEAGLLGLVGGIGGVLLGILASKIIEYIARTSLGSGFLSIGIPTWLVIACLVFAFLAGTISGAWPSYQASKIRPTEALRYE